VAIIEVADQVVLSGADLAAPEPVSEREHVIGRDPPG